MIVGWAEQRDRQAQSWQRDSRYYLRYGDYQQRDQDGVQQVQSSSQPLFSNKFEYSTDFSSMSTSKNKRWAAFVATIDTVKCFCLLNLKGYDCAERWS